MSGTLKKIGEGLLSLLFFGVVGAALYWLFAPPATPEIPPYQGVELQRDVHYVTSRAWPKNTWFHIEAPLETLRKPVVLKWLTSSDTGVTFSEQPPIAAFPATGFVTVLVHGYSAPERKVASYFAQFIDHIRAGAAEPWTFIVYDWPSKARRFEELTIEERRDWLAPPVGTPGRQPVNNFGGISWEQNAYNWDRTAAETAGAAGLVALLRTLRTHVNPQRINVVAHSMGSLVVLKTLLQDAESLSALRTLVLLAPDLASDALEPAKVWAAVSGISRVHVYFSRNDDILGLSRLKNGSARLGREGPANASALPGNVTLHDMTDMLGTADAVHSRYLEPASSAAVLAALR